MAEICVAAEGGLVGRGLSEAGFGESIVYERKRYLSKEVLLCRVEGELVVDQR